MAWADVVDICVLHVAVVVWGLEVVRAWVEVVLPWGPPLHRLRALGGVNRQSSTTLVGIGVILSMVGCRVVDLLADLHADVLADHLLTLPLQIVAVAVAALALVPLCCRKADEDIVFLEDEMDILYYYFRLWCAALDDAKNGPSLGTLVVHARKDLGGERAGEGKRISGAMNNTISGTLSTLSSSFTSSQTSASMGKRVEVMNFLLRVLLYRVLEVASLSLDLSFTIAQLLMIDCDRVKIHRCRCQQQSSYTQPA